MAAEQDIKKMPYRILTEAGSGEIEEKKSRFIGQAYPVYSEEEATALIESVKKKYWDARHNCYAFVLGERGQIARSSDDGEPSGTAGRPILEVLMGQEVRNCLVIVTRYFGGTLLGTGGLVRAYTQATQAALADAKIGCMQYGIKLGIDTDYTGLGKIQYLLGQKEIPIQGVDYTEAVTIHICIPIDLEEGIRKEVTTVTMGKAVIREEGRDYYLM